jgi:membrane associated rhomboid family serine protease
MFVAWMLFCLTGYAGPIANTAHVSGLLTGAALAAASRLLRPGTQ